MVKDISIKGISNLQRQLLMSLVSASRLTDRKTEKDIKRTHPFPTSISYRQHTEIHISHMSSLLWY